jgi:hypothetical protein
MAAKITFDDIQNRELDPSKLNFTLDSLTNAVGSGASDPSGDAIVGALHINTASGDVFRKIIAGASADNWRKISSITNTVLQNRYVTLSVNSAITSTDSTAPSVGDLVAYCGAGAWAASGAVSFSRNNAGAGGSLNATWVAGGTSCSATELFNGTSWSASSVLAQSTLSAPTFAGAQNSALVGGGNVASLISTTYLFNGTAWSAGAVMSLSKRGSGGAGTQMAAVSAGGANATVNIITITEIFNGSNWSTGSSLSDRKWITAMAGSQNATLLAGGISTNSYSTTEIFNGSAWSIGSTLITARSGYGGAGSLNAAIVGSGAALTTTELYNGSSWALSTNTTHSRTQAMGAGSQGAAILIGGTGFPGNTTEVHTQTIFRKVYAKNLPEANVVGILSSASTVMIQGTNTSITYPANKFLIANRSQNAALTNYANLSNISIVSVLGAPPTMTYNFSTTFNLLAVVPGNIAVISGGTVSAANSGSFVISRVINPSSIEVQNANGINENPITGTLSIINSMLAVDNMSPQDIVIGKTDSNGLLTLQKPLVTGNLLKRLK